MKFKVFYTDPYQPQHGRAKLLPRSLYKKVATFTDLKSLDEVWRQMNHVDGTEKIAKMHCLRSMSVGDIIVSDDKAFIVDAVGFKEVDFKP